MAKANKVSKKVNLKKDLRKHVSGSLEEMFKDFESAIGKRKFKRNIKKASKVLVASVNPEKLNTSAQSQDAKHENNGVVPTHVTRVTPDAN